MEPVGLLAGPTSLQGSVLGVPDWTLAVGALISLALAVALAAALGRSTARSRFASSREIIRAAHELAEGRLERPAALPPGDPLAPAADALARLSASLRTRHLDLDRRVRLLEELLAASTGTALLLIDASGEIRYASPGAEAMFGWRSGELIGSTLESLFADEEDLQALLPKLSRQSLREGTLVQWLRLRRRPGEPFRAELTVNSFRALPGGGEGFLFEVRDLSGEDALRDDLRDSEEMHRTLAESLPQGVFVVQEGRLVFANSSLARMLQAGEPLVGTALRDHIASENLLQVLDRIRRAESGEEPTFEIDCAMRPASPRWPLEVALSASRIVYAGKPAVIGTVREAGADRGLLRKVRVNETKLDAALGASEAGLMLVSEAPAGGAVTLANRRFQEMLGLTDTEVAGMTLEELAEAVAPRFEEPAEVRKYLRSRGERPLSPEGPSGGAGAPEPASFATAMQPRRVYEFSSRIAHARDGRVIGRLLSIRDISAQREQELRLAREATELARARDLLQRANSEREAINQELMARTAEIEAANRELRALDEMKSNLLSNVSHELQVPLVSIKGYTDMILKGRLGAITEEQRKGLEVSLRNIDRLIGMINDLLNFSRLEKEMSGLSLASFPLPELVEEAMEMVREAASRRRISLTSRYLTDDVIVRADRNRIAQVFINLLQNAVKFNRDGGQVQVEVRKGKKGYLIVDVRDSGVGIPRESLEKVFDRFYRDRLASAEGSGIGLSIVRDILRMHGCIIKADSKLGEGTVFTFTLPAADAESEPDVSGSAGGATGDPAARNRISAASPPGGALPPP